MKISVIGAINYDHIITHKGEHREGLGGILYNVIALANIFDASTVICPISRVGENHIQQVRDILSTYPNIYLNGITLSPTGTNENFLRYTSHDKRDEILKNNIKPIEFHEVEPYLDSDVILFNFISGFEIPLETIKAVKRNSSALLLMDIHNKVHGIDEEGNRFPKPFSDWREWLKWVDVVQLNEYECELIVNGPLPSDEELIKGARELLLDPPTTVLLTLGAKGSAVITKDGNSYYYSLCSAMGVNNLVDTTGCGDAFTSGYIYGYLLSKNPVKANALANVVAGINCEAAGISGFENLKEAAGRLTKVFPDLINEIEKGYKGEEIRR